MCVCALFKAADAASPSLCEQVLETVCLACISKHLAAIIKLHCLPSVLNCTCIVCVFALCAEHIYTYLHTLHLTNKKHGRYMAKEPACTALGANEHAKPDFLSYRPAEHVGAGPQPAVPFLAARPVPFANCSAPQTLPASLVFSV